jgi:hypothetical protein
MSEREWRRVKGDKWNSVKGRGVGGNKREHLVGQHVIWCGLLSARRDMDVFCKKRESKSCLIWCSRGFWDIEYMGEVGSIFLLSCLLNLQVPLYLKIMVAEKRNKKGKAGGETNRSSEKWCGRVKSILCWGPQGPTSPIRWQARRVMN